jgi:hypothetical protein
MTAMTKDDLIAENARRVEEMRSRAETDTAALRDGTLNFLRAKLPGTYRMEPIDAKVWGDKLEKRIIIVTEDALRFTLRFYVVQKSNRWGRNSTFEPCISGTEYQREGRTFRPVYARRKDGSYNYMAMLADIERCIARQRYLAEVNKCHEDANAKSNATLAKIIEGMGMGAKPITPRTLTHEQNGFSVSISAGAYSTGAVRVQVRLKDEYLTAEQALALIAKLEALK